MDGITSTKEIYKAIKTFNDSLSSLSQESIIKTKIVALTAYQDQNTQKECKAVGITEVYNKPMPFEQLHKLIWMDFKGVSVEEYRVVF